MFGILKRVLLLGSHPLPSLLRHGASVKTILLVQIMTTGAEITYRILIYTSIAEVEVKKKVQRLTFTSITNLLEFLFVC